MQSSSFEEDQYSLKMVTTIQPSLKKFESLAFLFWIENDKYSWKREVSHGMFQTLNAYVILSMVTIFTCVPVLTERLLKQSFPN